MGAGPGRVPYTLTRTVWLVSYSGTQKSKLVVESKSTQTARPRPAPPRPRHWWASINILIITKVRFVQPLCSCRCPTLSIWNVTLEVKTIRLVNRYVTLINILLSLWYIFTTQGFHHVTNLWSCHAGPLMNIKMLWCFLKFFVPIKSLLYSLLPGAAYSDHGGSGKQPADHLGNVSKVPHSVRCPPVLQKERLFVIFAPEVGGVLCRVWLMVEWWCNYKYPGTDHVLRNNCDTDNTWLQSVNVRRRLPANFRGISSSIGQQHINTICSSQHKMIIMTCRGPHYLDFLHYHGVRGTENELYYV